MIRLALLALLALAGCATEPGQPKVGLGLGITPQGVRVVPRVSTTVDGVTVGASPGGASIGTTVGGVGVGVGL